MQSLYLQGTQEEGAQHGVSLNLHVSLAESQLFAWPEVFIALQASHSLAAPEIWFVYFLCDIFCSYEVAGLQGLLS